MVGTSNQSVPESWPFICFIGKPQRSQTKVCIYIPIGSMVLLYMVTWIPSIYPSHVSINIPAPAGSVMGYQTGLFFASEPPEPPEHHQVDWQWISLRNPPKNQTCSLHRFPSRSGFISHAENTNHLQQIFSNSSIDGLFSIAFCYRRIHSALYSSTKIAHQL